MVARSPLPRWFLDEARALEAAYLAAESPRAQSGSSSGPERWRETRSPILEAVDRDGSFLDACCANGHLLECLVEWAAERGLRLEPYGIDIGAGLIALAKKRLPRWADRFEAANAWEWEPARRYTYVYTLDDVVPPDYLAEHLARLHLLAVERGGRLIVGYYGNPSRAERPRPPAIALESAGLASGGTSHSADSPPSKLFAWTVPKG